MGAFCCPIYAQRYAQVNLSVSFKSSYILGKQNVSMLDAKGMREPRGGLCGTLGGLSLRHQLRSSMQLPRT